MMMTRRALLISNPGEAGAENYCKGVYVDVRNYQRILKSAPGGFWNSNEIEHLDRPSVSDVRSRLSTLKSYEYVFIMFSGHGEYCKQRQDRILELRKGEEIGSLELNQGAKRRTIVVDCCQQITSEKRLIEAKSAQFSLNTQLRQADSARCRKLFEDRISSVPHSITRMFSCAIGELSYDDEVRGGRYNGSLIECFDNWVKSQQSTQISLSSDILSVVAAHNDAAAVTQKLSSNQQNPVIDKAKSSPYFPFAVFTE